MKKERKLNIFDLGFKEVCTKILTLIFITLCYSWVISYLCQGQGSFFGILGICKP